MSLIKHIVSKITEVKYHAQNLCYSMKCFLNSEDQPKTLVLHQSIFYPISCEIECEKLVQGTVEKEKQQLSSENYQQQPSLFEKIKNYSFHKIESTCQEAKRSLTKTTLFSENSQFLNDLECSTEKFPFETTRKEKQDDKNEKWKNQLIVISQTESEEYSDIILQQIQQQEVNERCDGQQKEDDKKECLDYDKILMARDHQNKSKQRNTELLISKRKKKRDY